MQEGMEVYAHEWKEVLAQVSDFTGEEWLSQKISIIPSWAKTPNPAVKRDAPKAARPLP